MSLCLRRVVRAGVELASLAPQPMPRAFFAALNQILRDCCRFRALERCPLPPRLCASDLPGQGKRRTSCSTEALVGAFELAFSSRLVAESIEWARAVGRSILQLLLSRSQPTSALRDHLNRPGIALKRWLSAAGITSGPLFRQVDRHGRVGGPLSAAAVGELVKAYVRVAGLDAREEAVS